MSERKIDQITTSVAAVGTAAEQLQKLVQQRAAEARDRVDQAISARIAALEDRRAVLQEDVDVLMQSKLDALKLQLKEVAGLTDPLAQVVFATDAVMTFDIADDVLPLIGQLGAVGEASTYPDKCTAAGPALVALKKGRPSFFWVNAFDRLNKRRTQGGDDVKVELLPADSFEDTQVEDMKDGRYKVSFLPTVAQECSCSVSINGEMCAGFPLALTVRPPTRYAMIGQEGEKAVYASPGAEIGQVERPVGAVLDPTCTQCIIADSANHRIQVFDVGTGAASEAYGRLGKARGQFSCPSSVCVLQQGNSVRTAVSDMLNHRIQVYEGTSGKVLTTMGSKGSGDGQMLFPRGVAANEEGELYICDQGNHRVLVFNAATGACVRKFGGKGTGPGQFNTPLAATVDMDGRVLVTDKNHRVQVFDKLGTFLMQWGKRGRKDGEFNYPSAVAVDDEGSVFVCDSSNSRVQIFTPEGKFVHKWGGHKVGGAPVEEGDIPEEGEEDHEKEIVDPWSGMKKPMGIALARDGTIWVVDHDRNQVLVY